MVYRAYKSTSMITCHRSYLAARCRERGYTLDEVRACIVSENGYQITVDVDHPAYPREPKPGFVSTQPTVTTSGPGTELKKLLSKIGITSTPTCSCNARAKKMDEWGPDECEKRIDEIVGWLKEEADKRGLPFIEMAGRILVRRAISNSRKNSK